MSILQALYDSEINFSISCFWDAGFEVALGDGVNGFVAETNCKTFAEAEAWLAYETVKHYPKSRFSNGKH